MKIADFGLARGYGLPDKNYTNGVVTLWYRPPDVLLGSKNYLTTVDIWSIGCIFAGMYYFLKYILEMASGDPLFPAREEEKQLSTIFKIRGTPNETSYPGITELPDWKVMIM